MALHRHNWLRKMPISPLKNEFLAKLPEPDYDRLRQMLQAVLLKKGQVLYVQGSSPDMIYFPVSTVVSFFVELSDGYSIEAIAFGRESIVGAAIPTIGSVGTMRLREEGIAYKISAVNFNEILLSKHPAKTFQKNVPTYNYNKIYKDWWHLTLEGKPDICWPGKIKYFALSSGTSESASKYIPITNDLLRGNKIIMIKQLISLFNYHDVPLASIGKGWLTLGGSTDLQKGPGYYAGDLSGITEYQLPSKNPVAETMVSEAVSELTNKLDTLLS
jgi:CRP-like cAMP-binding protein